MSHLCRVVGREHHVKLGETLSEVALRECAPFFRVILDALFPENPVPLGVSAELITAVVFERQTHALEHGLEFVALVRLLMRPILTLTLSPSILNRHRRVPVCIMC